MEIQDRLETLVNAAHFDVCGHNGVRDISPSPWRFIHRAALPGGGSVCLFKVLLTNVCTNDCAYCVNQIGRDCPRTSFKPEELARLFMQLYNKKMVRGLFLSSGIAGNASRTMESMIKAVEILRHHYEYKGYIHLKILPGASFDCVEEGCKLASRVSVNMEAPTAQHLARLSSRKDLYQGIVQPMSWVKKLMAANERLVPSGQTTQFVVGAAGESDRDILRTTEALYNEIGLRRVYYSAFRPVRNSRLEGLTATPPLREHRLYQADWLFRIYGFSPQEIELALGEKGNLLLRKDPKQVIAEKQPWFFPVDVNRASYDELLRVPGIGPISAKRIISTRQDHSIFSIEQLRKMRVITRRAVPYIWFQGMLSWEKEKQLSFIPELDDIEVPAPSLATVLG
jgi:putative DNA modification/repair radical SAM protein